MANLPKEPNLILTVPGDTPSCVLEIIRAILDRKVKIGSIPGTNFQIVVDYAPGDPKVVLGRTILEPD